MSGQCYGCGTEFGVFKKEHGCKNCGFAFCNACLHDKSIPIPKRNNSKHHVCQKCFKILTGAAPASSGQEKYDLPEAYLKRLAALKERETAGHSSQLTTAKKVLPEHLQRLDKADRELAMRLEKLKQDDKPKEKVTDAAIQQRLAQLKGQAYIAEQKPVYKPPDHRPQQQQVDDLLEQLAAEVYIDSQRPDPVQEVEYRLAKLRQGNGTKETIDNNMYQMDKGASLENDLNKADKMGPKAKGYNHVGPNIRTDTAETSASSDQQIDLQEMQRLMAQAAEELELDAQRAMEGMKQDKELMNRLKEIQKRKQENISNDSEAIDSDADNTSHSENTTDACTADDDDDDDDEENDESSARKIIERYVEEAEIEEALGNPRVEPCIQASLDKKDDKKKNCKVSPSSATREPKPSNLQPPRREEFVDSDYDDADELPYCCICTEDATIRCRDCDMDLYCQKCFHGCHAEMDITDHRTSPYKAPKSYR